MVKMWKQKILIFVSRTHIVSVVGLIRLSSCSDTVSELKNISETLKIIYIDTNSRMNIKTQ